MTAEGFDFLPVSSAALLIDATAAYQQSGRLPLDNARRAAAGEDLVKAALARVSDREALLDLARKSVARLEECRRRLEKGNPEDRQAAEVCAEWIAEYREAVEAADAA